MSKRKRHIGEVLEKQKIAVNKRTKYASLKQDPELYELIKAKEKKRYKKRKEKGEFQSINEKSPREQKVQRKKWREAAKRYREKMRNEAKEQPLELEPVLINPNESDRDDSNETNTIQGQENHLQIISKRKRRIGEVLEKQKIAVNKRIKYASLKQDPELYELIKAKEKKRYKKRKEKGEFQSINEKSPREQKVQRKKWREAAKRYREKMRNEAKEQPIKLEPVSINDNDSDRDDGNETNTIQGQENPLETPTPVQCCCSVKIKRIRYLEYKKRMQFLKVIKNLKKENRRLKRKRPDKEQY